MAAASRTPKATAQHNLPDDFKNMVKKVMKDPTPTSPSTLGAVSQIQSNNAPTTNIAKTAQSPTLQSTEEGATAVRFDQTLGSTLKNIKARSPPSRTSSSTQPNKIAVSMPSAPKRQKTGLKTRQNEWAAGLSTTTARLDAAVQQLAQEKAAHERELKQLQNVRREEVARINVQHAKALTDVRQHLTSKHREEQELIRKEFDELKQSYIAMGKVIAETKAEHTKIKDDIRHDLMFKHQEEKKLIVKELEDKMDEEIAKIKAQHSKEIDRVKKDLVSTHHEERYRDRKDNSERETRFRDLNLTLVTKIEELKRERELVRPLLDIGAAVRLRFLEDSRKTLFNVPRSNFIQCISENGNRAAHSANGAADFALYHGGYLANDSIFNDTFEWLYDFFPSNYKAWIKVPEPARRASDCQSTVHVTRNMGNPETDKSSSDREEHKKLLNAIYDLYEDSLSGASDYLARDAAQMDWLGQLEHLTSQIVAFDRHRSIRPENWAVSSKSVVGFSQTWKYPGAAPNILTEMEWPPLS